uniref:Secreted protein n=1 Tax=Heterorhabditis bacteriophora TaxID=37862 RepID=A0A1I7XH32_HETBA
MMAISFFQAFNPLRTHTDVFVPSEKEDTSDDSGEGERESPPAVVVQDEVITQATTNRRPTIQPATTPDPTATQSPFHHMLKPGIFAGKRFTYVLSFSLYML